MAIPPLAVATVASVAMAPIEAPVCDEHDATPDAMPTTPAPQAFTKLDAEIRQVQSRPGKYVYTGNVVDVMGDGKGSKGAFRLDAEEALKLAHRLEKVVEKNEAPEWSVVAQTRDAEMFERLRDGLVNTTVYVGPGPTPAGQIELLTPQQSQLLMRIANAATTSMAEDAVLDLWNKKKEQEVEAANDRIVDRYARAARSVDTKNPAAIRAVRRLAHYTSELGDRRMAQILGHEYVPNMYQAACARLGEPH